MITAYQPTEFLGDSSEYDLMLPWIYKQETKSLKHPYFLSTLFPEVNVALCIPLESPFDTYAITHYGTVFSFKPLRTIEFDQHRIIDPTSIIEGRTVNDKQVVTLNTKHGYSKTFLVHRLVLDRFYNIKLTERIDTTFVDGDTYNAHVANLEAYYR